MVRVRSRKRKRLAILFVGRVMRRYAGAFAAAVLLVVAGGCGGDEPETAQSLSSGPGVFEGTPEEHAVLIRGCLDDKGFSTGDHPSNVADGYLIDLNGVDTRELEAALDECLEEIGQPKVSGLSEAELQNRYDARIDQFECLAANDLLDGDPPTFEVFVEEYNRSGQEELWEPTSEASTTERDGVLMGPTDVCPRSGQTW